jgi:nucleoside-triphosphatase
VYKTVYLLTGRPGTGKTSIIKQVLAGSPVKAGGFYTEEIRHEGTRLGFKLDTLNGKEATLAHIDFSKRFSVGKYGVDIAVMDKIGVPALLEAAARCDLVVVDEIGKMELFSSAFRKALLEIIGSGKKVLGTIMLYSNPFADAIKNHPSVNIMMLTRENYQKTLQALRQWLLMLPDSMT